MWRAWWQISRIRWAVSRPPERPSWLTFFSRLGGWLSKPSDGWADHFAADRRQAFRSPGTVSVRIAARPWMPGAFAVRLVHPLCLPDRGRCVPVHLALPLPSRFAGPDWGTGEASPVPGDLSRGLPSRQTGCFPAASFADVPPERFR